MALDQLTTGSQEARDVVNAIATAVDAVQAANVGGTLAGKSLVGKPGAGSGVTSAITAATANTVPLYDGTSIAFAKVPAAALATADSAKVPGTPTFSLGSETAHARVVTITLKDLAGTTLAAVSPAKVWVSDTAGAAPSGTPPSGATSVTTGVQLKEVTTKVLFEALSNSSGVIALTVTEATAKSFFVNVAYGGVVASSAAVAFAG
jgi:hypothetical protein